MKQRLPEPVIIYEDEHVLAVCKPSGMPTVVGRQTSLLSQREWLARRIAGGDLRAVLPVHRIDRDTSGLLLFARTKDAQRSLSIQFQNREAAKQYLAIVAGGPLADTGLVELAVGPDRRDPKRSRIDPKRGRPAATAYEVLQRFRGYALVRFFPRTGRRHQIRLHAKALGCPLAVDPLYGEPSGLSVSKFKRDYHRNLAERAGREQHYVIRRLTLHAHRLTVQHPADASSLQVTAPLPKDMLAALKQLRRWAAVQPEPHESIEELVLREPAQI